MLQIYVILCTCKFSGIMRWIWEFLQYSTQLLSYKEFRNRCETLDECSKHSLFSEKNYCDPMNWYSGLFQFFFWACKFSAYFQNLMGSAAVEDEEIERRHFARLKFIIIEQNIVLLHGILAALGKTGYSMHSSPFEASILELRPHCCGRRYCPR